MVIPRKEVTYQEHLITQVGVKANPSNFHCIQNFPESKTQKSSNNFLGLTDYSRHYI